MQKCSSLPYVASRWRGTTTCRGINTGCGFEGFSEPQNPDILHHKAYHLLKGTTMSMTAPVSKDPLARLAEEQTWITPKAEIAVQDAIASVFNVFGSAAPAVREALHGTWLHEPLHSVMVELPVGSWMGAVLFDTLGAISGSEKLNFAADALVWLGLVGATGSAITGLNDWGEVKREAPRKVGAVHALMNVAASALFVGSVVARRKNGSRSIARGLATVGLLVVSASAHLGGNMTYEHGIGVEYGGKRWQD